MRVRSLSSIALFLALPWLALSCGGPSAEEEDLYGSVPYPGFQGRDFSGEKNFAELINKFPEGKVEQEPWAGFWWPYTSNGIASGSFSGGTSPAGKYDAVRGGATNAQNWEVSNHGARVKGVQGWWGHCNGWCAAAALYPEPKEEITINGIRFSIADQKALITEAGMSANADFYGNRVDLGTDYNSPKYSDTIPNQYFLVLANYVGKLKQAVLIDRFTGHEVWNQPLAGYRFEYPKPEDYLGADPSAPNVYRILVTSTIWWMRDDVSPGVVTAPFKFEENEFVQSRTLRMEVWLDGPVVFGANGKIQSSGNVVVTRQGDHYVGGSWRLGDGYYVDAWPDYMWIPFSIVRSYDPEEDYVNPHVDIEWLKEHMLVPGGRDDTTASPRPVVPAPAPCPLPSSLPSTAPSPNPWPYPWPSPTATATPTPTPTATQPPPPPPPPPSSPLPTNEPERPEPEPEPSESGPAPAPSSSLG